MKGFEQPTHELFIHDTKVCLRSLGVEKQPMVLILYRGLFAMNGLKIVLEFKTNVLIQAWSVIWCQNLLQGH
jgi:hypothetical protein